MARPKIELQYAEIVRDVLLDQRVYAAINAVLEHERTSIVDLLRRDVADHKFTEAAESESQLKFIDSFQRMLARHAAPSITTS